MGRAAVRRPSELDREPFSIRSPTQMEQNELFASREFVLARWRYALSAAREGHSALCKSMHVRARRHM
jgi:hypothetical protein